MLIKTYSKYIIAAILALAPTLSVLAHGGFGSHPATSPSEPLQLQNQTLAPSSNLDTALTRINRMISQIQSIEILSPAIKQSILSRLVQTQETLLEHQQSTDLALSNEAQSHIYLEEHREILREQGSQAMQDMARQATDMLMDFEKDVSQLLEVLYITCDQESQSLLRLTTMLDQLSVSVSELQTAMSHQEWKSAMQHIQSAIALLQRIQPHITSVQQVCIP